MKNKREWPGKKCALVVLCKVKVETKESMSQKSMKIKSKGEWPGKQCASVVPCKNNVEQEMV